MKVLNKEKDLFTFFELMKKTSNRALLLDYDGTLAPFRIKRDEARPYPGVAELLDGIIETQKTRLVLISGRGLDDLIPLLGMAKLPEIWGSHGGERLLPNGKYNRKTVPESLERNLKKVADWLKKKGWSERLEKKPLSLALHWRGMKEEEIAKISMTVKAQLPRLVNEKVVTLHEFDGGLEFRPCGITKAEAVNRIIGEMSPDTIAAYLGDDLTDEDAFAALKGKGLAVLVRKELRETCADIWIRPPDELLDFLRQWQRKPKAFCPLYNNSNDIRFSKRS